MYNSREEMQVVFLEKVEQVSGLAPPTHLRVYGAREPSGHHSTDLHQHTSPATCRFNKKWKKPAINSAKNFKYQTLLWRHSDATIDRIHDAKNRVIAFLFLFFSSITFLIFLTACPPPLGSFPLPAEEVPKMLCWCQDWNLSALQGQKIL